jgi:uncharacterized protein
MKQGAAAALATPLLTCSTASAAEAKPAATIPLHVAVLTGGHAYDVPNFHKLFRSLPGLDVYIQSVEDFVFTPEAVRDWYDVVVSYHMLTQGPEGPFKTALEHLGTTEQGLVVLHHALLAYPAWPFWSELVGIANRKFWFYEGRHVKVQVVNPQHPITRGLQSWEMVDETYTMADAGDGSEILLKVDLPKSMKTIGWTRHFRKARVFCLQSGHDNRTWVNAHFREVLRRGILWTARRL